MSQNFKNIEINKPASRNIVKLQFKLNSSVQVGQGVDFVFPLSQEQEEQQEEPSPKSTRTKCTTDLEFGTKTQQIKLRPHQPSPGG